MNSSDTLCAQQSSQGNAVGNILRVLAMVSNMQTQLQFLPCYHHTVLFQFLPPSFHWEAGFQREEFEQKRRSRATASPPPETNNWKKSQES